VAVDGLNEDLTRTVTFK